MYVFFFLKQILHKSIVNGLLCASQWREATTGVSPKSVGDGGSPHSAEAEPPWRQGARGLSLSVNEGRYIKVLKGRPYHTPICNVGFLYWDGRILVCRSHRCPPTHLSTLAWHSCWSLGKNRNLIHPLAGLWKSCNFAGSWSRTRNEKPVDYQDVRGGRKDVPSSDNRLTPLFWGVFFFSFYEAFECQV